MVYDTDCSSCRVDLKIDTEAGTVTANENRVEYKTDMWDKEELIMWDCPVCGEADSYAPFLHEEE